MNVSDLHKLLDEILKTKPPEKIADALQALLEVPLAPVLTIIANAGIHQIPNLYLRGEIYEASRGNWDASNKESLLNELNAILSRLAQKLRSERWQRVYLIPTGHPILSLQIKAMVYRLLRLNTIDLYYKAGTYFEVDLDQRAIALDSSDHIAG